MQGALVFGRYGLAGGGNNSSKKPRQQTIDGQSSKGKNSANSSFISEPESSKSSRSSSMYVPAAAPSKSIAIGTSNDSSLIWLNPRKHITSNYSNGVYLVSIAEDKKSLSVNFEPNRKDSKTKAIPPQKINALPNCTIVYFGFSKDG